MFDFDGTLAHLTIDFNEMKKRLGALGRAFIDDLPAAEDMPALEWIEKVSGIIREEDPDLGKEFNTRCRFLVTSMEIEAAKRGGMFSYSIPILKMLKNKGIKTSVISRNSSSAIKTVFPDILKYNECVLAREDVKLVKPDPAHLIAALDIMKVDFGRTLMVGDHTMDIETGKNAGTMSAGVASGNLSISELQTAAPDFTAADCDELMFMLRKERLI